MLLISILPGQPEPLCLVIGIENLDGFVDDVEPVFFILDVVPGEPEPLCLLLGLDAQQRRRALPRTVQ